MSNLEFVASISTTFVDEINKFITTFTNTIKNQFEDVENKLITQTNELNKLKEELKTKKFDESNYTSVSVIKNQDKQIHELTNIIKTLENRIKFLEMKTIKESASNPIVSAETIQTQTSTQSTPLISLINKDVEINSNIIENLHPVSEKKVELEHDPTSKTTVSKKPIKKISKKSKEEVEPSEIIQPVNIEIISVEKPKRKIPLKKPTKTELKVKEEIKEEIEINTTTDTITDTITDTTTDTITDTTIDTTTDTTIDTTIDTTTEDLEKEKADVELELENKRLEKEKADAEVELENKRLEKEKADSELEKEKKNTKIETKKESKQSTKKDTKKEKEIKIEDTKVIEVKYPDTIPDLESVIILEFDNIDYYLDEKLNNIFQITEDEEIGVFIGVYDKDNKKILKMNA